MFVDNSILNLFLKSILFFILLVSLSAFLLVPLFFRTETEPPAITYSELPTRIAVIDSGCSNDQSFVVEFKNFVNSKYGYLYGETTPYDTVGHGRYVCQLIHSNSPDSMVFSAKIANKAGEITYDAFYAAIDWAVLEVKAHVINISIGTLPVLTKEIVDVFTDYTEKYGVIFSISTGNDGTPDTDSIGKGEWPAIIPSTIGVGSIDLKTNTSYYFSSWGRNIYGIYTTDFVADGSPLEGMSLRGTSFSTPIITAYIANYREYLIGSGIINPTPQLIEGLMVRHSSGYKLNYFDEKLGWGVVQDIRKNPLPENAIDDVLNSTFLFGGGKDRIKRFNGENFSISWKAVSTYINYSLFPPQLDVSGNASDFVTMKIDPFSNWGSVITAEFSIPQTAPKGIYVLNVTPKKGNNLTYQFEIVGSYNYSILLDNSFSINGLNFEYGALFDLQTELRNNLVLPKFNNDPINEIPLKNYDAIIVLQPGSTMEGDTNTVFSNFNETLFATYTEFIANGGKVMFLLDNTIEDNKNAMNNAFASFGVSISKKFPVNSKFSSTNDLNDINVLDGVTSLIVGGYSIETTSHTYTELGFYQETITDILGTKIVTSVIGILGLYGKGKFIAFSGYDGFVNENIPSDSGLSYGNIRFLINVIHWMSV